MLCGVGPLRVHVEGRELNRSKSLGRVNWLMVPTVFFGGAMFGWNRVVGGGDFGIRLFLRAVGTGPCASMAEFPEVAVAQKTGTTMDPVLLPCDLKNGTGCWTNEVESLILKLLSPLNLLRYVPDEDKGGMKLQINAQNCVHCKCCSIKTPQEGQVGSWGPCTAMFGCVLFLGDTPPKKDSRVHTVFVSSCPFGLPCFGGARKWLEGALRATFISELSQNQNTFKSDSFLAPKEDTAENLCYSSMVCALGIFSSAAKHDTNRFCSGETLGPTSGNGF